MASSELYIHVPATYGNPRDARFGTPEYELFVKYPEAAGRLLYLHLRMVMYSKTWRMDGILKDAHVAALIPWSQNGPDSESNLRTLCRSCNSSKGARC